MDWKPTREAPDAWRMTGDIHAEHGKGDPFAAAIRATRMSMLITDPRQPDNPIIFANDAFLRLTGYQRDEVVGRNCRFLQGPETDPREIDRVRDAIERRENINVDLLNYRKDGTPFWNALYLSPVSNESGETQFFFASQLDVTERKTAHERATAERDRFEQAVRDRTVELEAALEARTALLHEVDHRVKNNLQMISSLILMQSRQISDPAVRGSLRTMLERVEALSTVHRRLYQSEDVTAFELSDFVRDHVSALVSTFGLGRIDVSYELEPVSLPATQAAPVALMINELVTNVLKHAFPPNAQDPRLHIVMRQIGERYMLDFADNGVGMSADGMADTFGRRLISSLARQLGATVEWSDAEPGTRVTLAMPAREAAPRHVQ